MKCHSLSQCHTTAPPDICWYLLLLSPLEVPPDDSHTSCLLQVPPFMLGHPDIALHHYRWNYSWTKRDFSWPESSVSSPCQNYNCLHCPSPWQRRSVIDSGGNVSVSHHGSYLGGRGDTLTHHTLCPQPYPALNITGQLMLNITWRIPSTSTCLCSVQMVFFVKQNIILTFHWSSMWKSPLQWHETPKFFLCSVFSYLIEYCFRCLEILQKHLCTESPAYIGKKIKNHNEKMYQKFCR